MLFAHTLIKHCDPVRTLKDSCASIYVKCRRIHPPMGVWMSADPVSLSDLWWTSLCTPEAWRYDDSPDVGALLSHLPPQHERTTAPPSPSVSISALSLASFIMPEHRHLLVRFLSDSQCVKSCVICQCCYELKANPQSWSIICSLEHIWALLFITVH